MALLYLWSGAVGSNVGSTSTEKGLGGDLSCLLVEKEQTATKCSTLGAKLIFGFE